MTKFACAAAAVLLLSGCAGTGAGAGAGAGPSPSESAAVTGDGEGLVLRIAYEGGFVPPEVLVGRMPSVSVYADGRIITEGPQIAIYPGPALPAVQVQQVDPALVRELPGQAEKAGVRTGADFGMPGVADAPDTRVTVTSAGRTQSVRVTALREAQPEDRNLTAAQRRARVTLSAFIERVEGLAVDKDLSAPVPYRPESIAALVQPYREPSAELPSPPPAVRWPGPALPGEPMGGPTELTCVTASGPDAAAVLAAAAPLTAITGWTSGGKTWTVTFRPLLPDETGCASLRAAR